MGAAGTSELRSPSQSNSPRLLAAPNSLILWQEMPGLRTCLLNCKHVISSLRLVLLLLFEKFNQGLNILAELRVKQKFLL